MKTSISMTRQVTINIEGYNFEAIFKAALAAGVPVERASVNYTDMPYEITFVWGDVATYE